MPTKWDVLSATPRQWSKKVGHVAVNSAQSIIVIVLMGDAFELVVFLVR